MVNDHGKKRIESTIMRSNEKGLLVNLPTAKRSMYRGSMPRGTCCCGEKRLHKMNNASKGFKNDDLIKNAG